MRYFWCRGSQINAGRYFDDGQDVELVGGLYKGHVVELDEEELVVSPNHYGWVALDRLRRPGNCPDHDQLRYVDNELDEAQVAAYLMGGRAAVLPLIRRNQQAT